MTTTTKATRPTFTTGEPVVYPGYGLGRITAVEEQEVAGCKLQVFVIVLEHNKMTLRVPVAKAAGSGLRRIAEPALVGRALEVLTGRARAKRGLWARRAQEYEAKIKSGDLLAVAEVVRDLYRSPEQAEPSHSERMLYESAVQTLVREVAAVHATTPTEARKLIEHNLATAPGPAGRPNPDLR